MEQKEINDETYKLLVAELWRRGNLRFLLDETQLLILSQLEGCAQEQFMFLCSRRLGKSYTLVSLAFSVCLRKENARVLYLAPFAKDAADIVYDIATTIMASCPEELKPDYNAQEKAFKFHNGSIIRFKGVNGEHAQFLRGGACDLVVLDECGIMDDLEHVLNDVVMPMVMTTDGRVILATTPPRTPGHDSAVIHERLAGKNATVKFTILDNHRISDEKKGRYLEIAGEKPEDIPKILSGEEMPKSTTALREYFCEFVTDASQAVLPEFPAYKKKIVKESPRPSHFDSYVAMDPGMKDRTGLLYAYWDFRRGKIVIEDEDLLERPSSLIICGTVIAHEHKLWGDKAPYLRISDHDEFLIRDIYDRHKLVFIKAEKQDSLGAINYVRNIIQTEQIEINPRCKHLIRQMENAIWNNKATDFARAGDKSPDGHFDLVAALKYLCRHVNMRKNPYPVGFRDTHPMQGNTFKPTWRSGGNNNGLFDKTPIGNKLAKKNKR